jgi:hypothetical protein
MVKIQIKVKTIQVLREFDTMSNDELDNAGFTGDKDLGPNK